MTWREGTPGIFVQRDGAVHWRPVKLGLRNREQVEVQEGVAAGEQILLPSDAAAKSIEGREVVIR